MAERFPLLEQMRADRAERIGPMVDILADLRCKLAYIQSDRDTAWLTVRTLAREKAAIERAVATNLSGRVREEVAAGAARALKTAILDAMAQRDPHDQHMIEVKVPVDLRNKLPGTIEQFIIDEYLSVMKAEVDIVSRMAPTSAEGIVSEQETGWVEHLRITIPQVQCERAIMHWDWLQPKEPQRTK